MRRLMSAMLGVVLLSGTGWGDEAAVKWVKKLGGKIKRDDAQPGKPVVKVFLNSTEVEDADLKNLKDLKHLVSLDLFCCYYLTEAAMKELKGLKQLKELSLRETGMTGNGLKELKELKQLTTLNLRSTQVTDAGLKELKELTQLTTLNIGDCGKVTTAGLDELMKALPECSVLY